MTAIENLRRQAARDAQRYLEAKMNYGQGAGNQRKIINAQVQERMKNEIYKAAFEAALAGIDKAGVAEKIQKKKGVQRVVEGTRKGLRTARRAEGFYYRNRYWIDSILGAIFK